MNAKALDLKPGDILALTFEDDLDPESFERARVQVAPICREKGVMAVFLERLTPVIVRPDGAILAVNRERLAEALRVLLEVESLGDQVYSVRDKAASSGDGFTGNSWDHPRVSAFSAAIETLTLLAEALKPAPAATPEG